MLSADIMMVLNKIQSGIVIVNPETKKIVEVNSFALELIGGSRNQVLGKKCYETICPASPDGCPMFDKSQLVDSSERVLVKLDGTEIPILKSCGEIVYQGKHMLIESFHDISDQKEIEQSLQLGKKRLSNYIDISNSIILTLDRDGNVELINKRGCELLGYDRDEIIGTNWFDRFIPEDSKEEISLVFETLLSGDIEPMRYIEGRVISKSGEEFLIAWNNTIVREDGLIVGTLSSGMDITEQRMIEQSLRANEMRTRTILDSVQTGVVLIEMPSKIIREANTAAHSILEVDNSGLVGSSCEKYLCDSPEGICPAIDSDSEIRDIERTCMSGKGKSIQILKNVSPLILENKEYLLETFVDITRIKETELRLESSNAQLKERVKEIQALQRFNEILYSTKDELQEVLPELIRVIEEGFQYPDLTSVRISIDGEFFTSNDFKDSSWYISSPIVFMEVELGKLEIYYSEEREFLKEEQNLIDSLSRQIGASIVRKRIEQEVKRERVLLKAVTEANLEALIVIDSSENVIIWNHAATVMFGYTAKEVIGKPIHSLIAPERYHRAMQEGFHQFVKTGTGNAVGRIVKMAGLHKDGKEFPIELSLSSFRNEDGWHAVGSVRDITKREQVLNEIKLSEKRYRDLIDFLPEGIAIGNLEEEIILANPAMAKLLGFDTAEEFIGRNLLEFIDPDELDIVRSHTELRTTGASSVYNIHMRDRDGVTKEVYVSAVPRVNTEGTIEGSLGVFIDVTERRRTEKELRQTTYELQKRIREIEALYSLSDLLKLSAKSTDIEKNRKALFEDILSSIVTALQYPQIACGKITIGYDEGQTKNYEPQSENYQIDIFAKGDKVGTLEIGYLQMMPEAYEGPFLKEEIALFNRIATEIGMFLEREIIQSAFEDQRKRLESISNSTFDALLVMNWDGRIVFWNRSAERLFGYNKSEIIGVKISKLIPDQKFLSEVSKDAIREGFVSRVVESEGLNNFGSRFQIEIAIAPILISSRLSMVMSIRDITERKAMDLEKEQQQKELEIYASLLRHDLGNDLNAIVGNMEVVSMIFEQDPIEAREFLDASFAAAERMDNLLKSISRGTLMKNMDFMEMLREVASISNRANKNSQIDIQTNRDFTGVRVGGSKLLPTVFENLFRNSIQHIDTKPIINVRVSQDDSDLIIIVSDNGRGIPETIKDEIFERGVSTKGKDGGLGLYLSKRIVEACNGTIRILDTEEGEGAKFEIVLPILQT